MKLNHLKYLLIFLSLNGWGQTGSWWIDKPIVHQDSINLIKGGYSKINVYQMTMNDSSKFIKQFLGTWVLKFGDSKILSSNWTGKPFDKNDILPIIKQKYKRRKIIETTAYLGNDRPQSSDNFLLIHNLDASGKVKKTTVKAIRKARQRWESRYFFDRIIYKYNNDLLFEADYNYDGIFVTNDFTLTKYVFEYEK